MTQALRDASEHAMHVVAASGEVYVGDRAVIYVYEGLGYRAVAALRAAPLRWLTPPLYRFVVAHRRSLAPWFFRQPEEESR